MKRNTKSRSQIVESILLVILYVTFSLYYFSADTPRWGAYIIYSLFTIIVFVFGFLPSSWRLKNKNWKVMIIVVLNYIIFSVFYVYYIFEIK
jgi:predicted Na+-dependent transporter